jgi:hypothetical protein
MPLDGMREEMIRQLEEQSATPAQIADYQTRWNHAMTHPGEPLPCPLCFLGGEMRRLRSISDEGGVGVARCEHCRETFEYAAPEAT